MKTLSKLSTLPTLPSKCNPREIAKLNAAELVERIQGKTCWTTFEGTTRKGKIEGGILNPMNHAFIFKAFHILFPDGQRVTMAAAKVTIASD